MSARDGAVSAASVAIGLPVYNGEAFLAAAIASVLAQSFSDFELLVSDNASTDATAEICARFAAQDARVRYVRQAKNIGAKANFRYVLAEATAPLFMWMAADDICEPDMLGALVAVHDQDPCVVLATTDVLYVDTSGTHLEVTHLDTIRADPAGGRWPDKRRRFFRNPASNILYAIYGLYRRESLVSLKLGFGEGLRYESGLEIPLLAQMACRGKIVSIAAVGKHNRNNLDSVYYREQATMRPWHRLDNLTDISRKLYTVLADAPLTAAEKWPLYATVTWDMVFGTVRLIFGSLYRAVAGKQIGD